MSKSTPISNLPNLKKQSPPAFEQRENDIVNEILSEIDNDKKGSTPAPQAQPPAQQGPTPEQIQMMQQQQQAMIQQQMLEQQLMEQQMREQQMNTQEPSTEGIVAKPSSEPKAFYEELLDTLKPSLLVAVIVALISLPVLSTIIEKAVSSKESLKKFAMPLTLALKGLIGGGLFYGGSTALQL